MKNRSRRTEATDLVKLFELKLGPASEWAGNCYAIACAVVTAKLAPAGSVAVYGHWTGPIHRQSQFYHAGLAFARHGWVLLPDGTVCDPTRWVFEHVKPYVYVGRADHYDEGGNALRTALAGRPPDFDPDQRQHYITESVMPSPLWTFVEKLLQLDRQYADGAGPGVLCEQQLTWLANRSPQVLGEHASAIYAALDKLGLDALVPWDNRQMVARLARSA